jgi:hypothetical protein
MKPQQTNNDKNKNTSTHTADLPLLNTWILHLLPNIIKETTISPWQKIRRQEWVHTLTMKKIKVSNDPIQLTKKHIFWENQCYFHLVSPLQHANNMMHIHSTPLNRLTWLFRPIRTIC